MKILFIFLLLIGVANAQQVVPPAPEALRQERAQQHLEYKALLRKAMENAAIEREKADQERAARHAAELAK